MAARFETVAWLTCRRGMMAGMADDELDTLYWVPPEEFTAQRTALAKGAKSRGDAAAAKQISAARKPTTAAWIVNRLALGHQDALERLAELGDALRAAHAAMDGERIRDLSAEQHRLVKGLVRVALQVAEVKSPSSAVRDDISGTLQAAIADPGVRRRLGRLSKAERWSGFGDLGDLDDTTPVPAPDRTEPTAAPASPRKATRQRESQSKEDRQRQKAAEAARRHREKLTEALTAAERAEADAEQVLAERQSDRDAARARRDEALATLRDSEAELRTAENRFERAQQAGRIATEAVRAARTNLERA